MRIVELVINELEGLTGVEALSVVELPAIESNFIALSKQKTELKTVDQKKRILMGPALIPNKAIYRNDPSQGEYYIYFTTKTVEQASQLFLQAGNQSKATVEHEIAVEGLTVVESWLVVDDVHDKSRAFGFNSKTAPVGTWMVCQKVHNDQVWQDAEEGKLKGFSIEAYFADKFQMPQAAQMKEELLIEEIKRIIEDGQA